MFLRSTFFVLSFLAYSFAFADTCTVEVVNFEKQPLACQIQVMSGVAIKGTYTYFFDENQKNGTTSDTCKTLKKLCEAWRDMNVQLEKVQKSLYRKAPSWEEVKLVVSYVSGFTITIAPLYRWRSDKDYYWRIKSVDSPPHHFLRTASSVQKTVEPVVLNEEEVLSVREFLPQEGDFPATFVPPCAVSGSPSSSANTVANSPSSSVDEESLNGDDAASSHSTTPLISPPVTPLSPSTEIRE